MKRQVLVMNICSYCTNQQYLQMLFYTCTCFSIKKNDKKPLQMVWPDCWTAKVKAQVHQTLPQFKGLINVYMCIKFKVDTAVNIEVKMLSNRQMDGQTDLYHQNISQSCLCIQTKYVILSHMYYQIEIFVVGSRIICQTIHLSKQEPTLVTHLDWSCMLDGQHNTWDL